MHVVLPLPHPRLSLMLGLSWLLSGCGVAYPNVQMDMVPRVAVVAVQEPAEQTERVLLSVAEPGQDVTLAAQRPGRVVARVVEPGRPVASGAAILELDGREARANLTVASAALDEARAVEDDARQQQQRVSAMGDGASASQQQAAATAVARAEAAVRRAEGQLRLARLEVEHTTVSAPFDGELTALGPEVGELVGAGAPVGRLVSTDAAIVRIGLLEDEVVRAADATYVVRAGSRRAQATLDHVSAAADPRTLDWPAELRVEDPPFPLGAPVEVRLTMPRGEGGAVVPPSAVVDEAVWVVEEGRVRRVPVRLVDESRQGLIVEGVSPGASVVIYGAEALEDGAEVRLVERTP